MADVIFCKVPPTEKRPSGLKIVVPGKNGIDGAMKDIPPETIEYEIMDESLCPQDRYFRHAWELKDKKPQVNMTRAKQVHIQHLRSKRAEMFQELDKKFMMAIEKSDQMAQARVSEQKQKLRDMPQDPIFDSANTPEELKATVPAYMLSLVD